MNDPQKGETQMQPQILKLFKGCFSWIACKWLCLYYAYICIVYTYKKIPLKKLSNIPFMKKGELGSDLYSRRKQIQK